MDMQTSEMKCSGVSDPYQKCSELRCIVSDISSLLPVDSK